MSEEEAVKVFQEDGYFDYQKRSMRYGKNLSPTSIWAKSPATMFVAFLGETPVGVIGYSKYKGVLLGAGVHIRKEYRRRGLGDILIDKILKSKGSKTLYVNFTNSVAADKYRSKGFKDMKLEELPAEIREELEGTGYVDQLQKWFMFSENWWGVVNGN